MFVANADISPHSVGSTVETEVELTQDRSPPMATMRVATAAAVRVKVVKEKAKVKARAKAEVRAKVMEKVAATMVAIKVAVDLNAPTVKAALSERQKLLAQEAVLYAAARTLRQTAQRRNPVNALASKPAFTTTSNVRFH